MTEPRKDVEARIRAERERSKQTIRDRLNGGTDSAMGRLGNTVKCAVRDRECIQRATADGRQVDTSGTAPGGRAAAIAGRILQRDAARPAEPDAPTADDASPASPYDALADGDTVDAESLRFDPASGRLLRPQSRAALTAIGDVLTSAPDLRLRIVARIGRPGRRPVRRRWRAPRPCGRTWSTSWASSPPGCSPRRGPDPARRSPWCRSRRESPSDTRKVRS